MKEKMYDTNGNKKAQRIYMKKGEMGDDGEWKMTGGMGDDRGNGS